MTDHVSLLRAGKDDVPERTPPTAWQWPDLQQNPLQRAIGQREPAYTQLHGGFPASADHYNPDDAQASRPQRKAISSVTASPIGLLNGSISTHSKPDQQFLVSRKFDHLDHKASEELVWLPYALRWPWMILFICFGLALLIATAALHVTSHNGYGLVNDVDKPGPYFVYRFLPTLLAVSFTTMLMIVFDAVRRTEPFARMVQKHGTRGRTSILRTHRPWWSCLKDSLPTKENDRYLSITLLCSTIAYVLGILVLSPFSSALLTSHEISIPTQIEFNQVQLSDQGLLPLTMTTLDYLHTIGHMLQNVSTSPWINDEFVVVPYWPVGNDHPAGLDLVEEHEMWRVQSTVFQADLQCEELPLVAGPVVNNFTFHSAVSDTDFLTFPTNVTTYRFSGSNGCEYGVAGDRGEEYYTEGTIPATLGVMYWSNFSNINTDALLDQFQIYDDVDPQMLLNYTEQCQGSIIIVLPPTNTTDVQPASVHMCLTRFYQAELPVTLSTTNGESSTSFDQEIYLQKRVPLSTKILNTTMFEQSYLSALWTEYSMRPEDDRRPYLGGPANLLAGMNEFQLAKLAGDPDLVANAKRLQQRAFGQTLISALQDIPDVVRESGSIVTDVRRIIVIETVAIVIEVIVSLSIVLLIIVCWSSQLSRRPLGLSQDPALTNTVASLWSTSTSLNPFFRKANASSPSRVIHQLRNERFVLRNGVLRFQNSEDRLTDSFDDRRPVRYLNPGDRWQPMILTKWMVFCLVLTLCAFLAAIAVLYSFSNKHRLVQPALVYQISFGRTGDQVSILAPYAIVPTFIAVLIGLWWSGIENVFRLAQPFLTMSARATPSSHGSGVSYQSSYMIWAGFRALNRGQWLLALVCGGAFLSQILTISMSALWERIPYEIQTMTSFGQPFQLREVPHLFNADVYRVSGKQDILIDAFSNLTTNWLYGGLFELRLNSSQPEWSRDGWSFVPAAISGLADANDTGNRSSQVTIDVPAIRGRAECSPAVPDIDHKSYTINVNMSQAKLTSGQSIGPTGFLLNQKIPLTTVNQTSIYSISGPYTPVLGNDVPLLCCAHDNDGQPSILKVGYWSPVEMNLNFSEPSKDLKEAANHNFTAKWIHGSSPALYNVTGFTSGLVWPEPPELRMINCQPIIESARARVTIDVLSLQVRNYTILEEPTPFSSAWMDNFVPHAYYNQSGASFRQNITVSFGSLFMSALLGAAQLQYLGGCVGPDCHEQTTDRVFNYREPGLNVDFMSYAMLALAKDDFTSLLEYDTLTRHTQKVFTTFFQHFASSTVPIGGTGGWVYQRANETLPADLLPGESPFNTTDRAPNRVSTLAASSIAATLIQPVEMLQMSPVAVWLSLVIVSWLIITSLFVLALQSKYFSPLLYGVDSIAGVATMVAGSDRYLEFARLKGATGLRKDKSFKTRLGWFQTNSGQIRWGIELADDPEVRFLTEAEVAALDATQIEAQNGTSSHRTYKSNEGVSDGEDHEMMTFVRTD